MKKLTGALVLSLSLLMISGCRSSGETRGAEDASTPASAGTPDDNTRTPLGQEAGGPTGDTQPTLTADSGAMKQDSGTGMGSDSGTGGGKASGNDADRQTQESCIDKWAQNHKLDRYGNPEGTMYAGGSPLFDERTGETRDRLDYFYERQPEAKKACATAHGPGPDTSPAPKEAPPKKKK